MRVGLAAAAVLVPVAAIWLLDDGVSVRPAVEVKATAPPVTAGAPTEAVDLPTGEPVTDEARRALPVDPAPAESDAEADGEGEPEALRAALLGRVVDRDLRPVVGALVRAPGRPGASLARARTDERGRFALASGRMPEPGDGVLLLASHPGHALAVRHVDPIDGARVEVGDLELGEELVVRGHVVDEGGAGLAGVLVAPILWASGESGSGPSHALDDWLAHDLAVRSDEHGAFAIRGLGPGHGFLRLLASGCLPLEHEVAAERSRFEHDLGVVVLPAGRTIEGRVVDGDGSPVRDAVVAFGSTPWRRSARGAAHEELRQLVATAPLDTVPVDGQGRFEAAGMGRAVYRVLVGALGHETIELSHVVPGGDELVVALAPRPDVTLLVLDGDRVAVEEAVVAVATVEEASAWLAFGARPRVPVVERIEPGRFRLPDHAAIDLQVHVAARGFVARSAVVADLPRDGDHIVELVRECNASGHVDGPDGPVAGATVFVGGLEARTRTDGSWSLAGLPVGRYAVFARAPGHVPYSSARDERFIELPAPGSHGSMSVVLERAAALTGVVRYLDGSPARGREVTVDITWSVAYRRTRYELRTDGGGRFARGELPPGRAVVRADPGGEREVQLVAGSVGRVEITVPEPAWVRGRVRENGRPVGAGMRVALRARTRWDRAPVEVASGETDTSGDFALRAYARRGRVVAVTELGAGSAPVSVSLDPGLEVWVDLELVSHALTGRVVDERGRRPTGPVEVALVTDTNRWRADVDERGRFRFDGLPKGKHRLRASAPGHRPADEVVTVGGEPQPDDVVLTLVELPPRATIAGRLGFAGGVPTFDGTRVYAAPTALLHRHGLEPDWILGFPRARTSAGLFELTDLEPGVLTLVVRRPSDKGEIVLVELGQLEVGPGEEHWLDAVLPE